MDITEVELTAWKHLILTVKWQGRRELDALDRRNHGQFVALCHALLHDDSPLIRRVVLGKLGQHGDLNDTVAQEGARRALEDERLRDTALFALGRVGTSEAFPILYSYAVAGSYRALAAASKQVRAEEQRDQLVELARKDLFSYNGQLRAAAVDILMKHSRLGDEEERLLHSAEIFTDDFVLDALGHGSKELLPGLNALREKYPVGAENKAIVRAIARIENQG